MPTLPTDLPRLRPAEPGDDAFLKSLFLSTRPELAAITTAPAMLDLLAEMQWRAQRNGYLHDFPAAEESVIEAGGAALGRLLLERSRAPWLIVDIALLPAARGQGHGSAVLRALQQDAAAAGVGLALSVRNDNRAAHRLYDALGFVTTKADALAERMLWQAPAPLPR